MKKIIPVFIALFFCVTVSFADESFINQEGGWYKIRAAA